jgi:hypothetical protein
MAVGECTDVIWKLHSQMCITESRAILSPSGNNKACVITDIALSGKKVKCGQVELRYC